jgi:hypothetical protein
MLMGPFSANASASYPKPLPNALRVVNTLWQMLKDIAAL